MRARRSHAMWALGAATALAAVVGVWLVFRDGGTSTTPVAMGDEPAISTPADPSAPTPTSEATPPPDIPADPRIEYVLDLRSAEEHVFAMAWEGETLWFVGSQGGGAMRLYRYEPQTGALDDWPLPGSGGPGPYTYLVPTGDGGWWVTAGYALWRFDVATASAPVALDMRVAHSLDTGGPEGTWISAAVAAGDRLVLVRNGVAALFGVSTGGEVSRLRDLDRVPVGLASVAGEPLPFSDVRDVMREGGQFASVIPVLAIAQNGDGACRGLYDQVAAFHGVAMPEDGESPRDQTAMYAFVSDEDIAIKRANCWTGELKSYQLAVGWIGRQDIRSRGPPPPTGQPETFYRTAPEILSLAVSPSGVVAFADSAYRLKIIR